MAEGGDRFPHTHLRDGFKAFCVIHTLQFIHCMLEN